MKSVKITFKGTPEYTQLCEFSRRRYLKDLKLEITNYPDVFVYAVSERGIDGCMGLNLTIRSPLFKEDLPLLRILSMRGIKNCGEQSVFVVENKSPVCVPFLIATTARYGRYIGIDHIVYAGISVSCRTIEKLGFDTTKIGRTSIDCLDPDVKNNYRSWHDTHNPVTYLLDTSKAADIFDKLAERLKKKVVCPYNFKLPELHKQIV